MEHDLKQEGEKQTFDAGAQRDTQEGKPRLDLISPIMLDRLGTLLAKGAEHYGERNWEKGMPLSRVLASAMRHLNDTLDGLEDEDHPIQCVFNLMAYVHILHRIRAGSLPVELDDMPREKNLEEDLTSDKKGSTIRESSTLRCPKCYGSFSLGISTYHLNTVYCRRCGLKWKLEEDLTSDKKGSTIEDGTNVALCPMCNREIPCQWSKQGMRWSADCMSCNTHWIILKEPGTP